MAQAEPSGGSARALTVRGLGVLYREHLEALGRKRTTIPSAESAQRV